MEILVGKGGNQSMPIMDDTVSRVHCKIEVLDSGFIAVTNLSASGTYLNGVKLLKRTLAKREDTLQLGPSFTATINELIESEDYSKYTCHQVVSRKYRSSRDLQVFLSMSSQRASVDMPSYCIPVAKSAQACYLMDEKKYRDAQILIYEAGDALYDMQDGSTLLQAVYATILTVCARLYFKVGMLDVAQESITGACNIFDRISINEAGCSAEQLNETYSLATEIYTAIGDSNSAFYYQSKLSL